jgi:hypothetical protein
VHLESGQGRTISFKLQRSPLVTVQGTVYSVIEGGTTRADVTLTSLSDVGGTVRYTTKTDSKGVFEMSGISAGTYVLSAKSSSRDGQIGYSRIEVLDIDRPRADVVIGRGVDVSVRFSAEVPQALDLRGAQVSLVPLEPYLARPSNGSTPSVLVNVQPGPYLLDVAALPGNSYVRSARSAGYDVLEQALNVQYNTAALVEIELAVDGGQIAGIVADGGESTVVLIPDASRRHRPDQYRIAKSTAEGRFSINGVPPGDYRLFAWRSVETNAWLNSEFMLTNEQFGTNISVSPNSRASVQVRSIARSQ